MLPPSLFNGAIIINVLPVCIRNTAITFSVFFKGETQEPAWVFLFILCNYIGGLITYRFQFVRVSIDNNSNTNKQTTVRLYKS